VDAGKGRRHALDPQDASTSLPVQGQPHHDALLGRACLRPSYLGIRSSVQRTTARSMSCRAPLPGLSTVTPLGNARRPLCPGVHEPHWQPVVVQGLQAPRLDGRSIALSKPRWLAGAGSWPSAAASRSQASRSGSALAWVTAKVYALLVRNSPCLMAIIKRVLPEWLHRSRCRVY